MRPGSRYCQVASTSTHLDVSLGGQISADDFESGTAAAACGGITTICDYAWQQPGQSLAEVYIVHLS